MFTVDRCLAAGPAGIATSSILVFINVLFRA
jgi:hypothetical protein